MAASLPSPLALLTDAWHFFRKQSVLPQIWFWLLTVPFFLSDIASEFIKTKDGRIDLHDNMSIGLSAATFILFLVSVWGAAATLTVGKRLLQNKAGRTRTSFHAVLKQSRVFVLPLFFTWILWQCGMVLWALLLIVPGIVYGLNTLFFPVIVVGEKISYRPALRLSKKLMRSHVLSVVWRLLAIALPSVILIGVLTALCDTLGLTLDQSGFALAEIVDATGTAMLFALLLLVLTDLYAILKRKAGRFEQVIPGEIETA